MEIITHKSFGPIAFGDTRSKVRKKLAVPVKPFLKDGEPPEVDAFDSLSIHVHYDAKGKAEFVEAGGEADVTFRGVRFLGRLVRHVAKDMAKLGFAPDDEDCGLTYFEAGVAVYAPASRVEAVSGFRQGYYDGLRDDLAKLLEEDDEDEPGDLRDLLK